MSRATQSVRFGNYSEAEMAEWTDKLDAPLRRMLRRGELVGPVFVTVQHTGDVADLAEAGLQHAAALGSTLAGGEVRPEEVEQLASLPTVVSVRYGAEFVPHLETSVPEVRADQVWTLNRATGAFSGAGQTGRGVVVGIIDSGIDVVHPDFFDAGPPPRTRIKRVWDQGLTPVVGESSPAVALLAPTTTTSYGVEISDTEIDAELAGGAEVRHADCNGHGTHVASIAAGRGLGGGLPLTNVGVAPRADLVMVKIFSLVEDVPQSFSQRFKDAVHYILNVTRTQLGNKPVVINFSGGSPIGPHDGLEDDDIFLTDLFRGATGKIFVTSAGNAAEQRTHARITIPAGGQIDVPIEVTDARVVKVDRKRCGVHSSTKAIFADFWYPNVAGVTVQLRTPTDGAFRAAVARGADQSAVFDGGKEFDLFHSSEAAVRPAEPGPPPIASSTITRSQVRLILTAAGDDHALGTYRLRFNGPAGTVIEGWTILRASEQGMRFPAAPPAGIVLRQTDDTVSSPAGARHVLTVSAYNDVGGAIAFFSSRGVLVDYSGVGNLAVKPDLSAPGFKVTAASSSTTAGPIFRGLFGITGHFVQKSGTSMSAPHVAGAVALMLEKRPTLTVDQARTILTTSGQGARPTPPPKDFGGGKLDAKGAVDNVP